MQDLARNMLGMREGATVPSEGGGPNQPPLPVLALRKDEFWALNDINFSIKRGECLGLIGQNGSGKSTLLRLLTGIFPPDTGEINVRGRTGALISLGAGFHPHMTGRENIYLNAAILGLHRREIDERFQSIIEFAEIDPFIDAPVSTYSSGMVVKLGFAIAINVKADLLLIDEVLAVGDMGFKIKCLNAVRKLMADVAVVFVSHSMEFVSQFCTRIMVLKQGQVTCDTLSIADGIDHYLSAFPPEKAVAGVGGVEIKNVQLCLPDRVWGEHEEAHVHQGDKMVLSFDVLIIDLLCKNVMIRIYLMDQGMEPIVAFCPQKAGPDEYGVRAGCYHVHVPLGPIDLNAGKYSFVLGVVNAASRISLSRVQGVGKFRVVSDLVHWGQVVRKVDIIMERS
jgi:lipopolysaccharide transport system ATP-binding protein